MVIDSTKPRPRRLLVTVPGDSFRLDGVERGAFVANRCESGWRVRLTNQEGGAYLVDTVVPEGAPLAAMIRDAWCWALDGNRKPDGLRRIFDAQSQAA
jgi:hypothetical protein